jgi:hypothetical protein
VRAVSARNPGPAQAVQGAYALSCPYCQVGGAVASIGYVRRTRLSLPSSTCLRCALGYGAQPRATSSALSWATPPAHAFHGMCRRHR